MIDHKHENSQGPMLIAN